MKKNLEERQISSETIFEGRMIKVYKDKVGLPDGKEALREVVRHPGAVAIVPLLEDKVLMVRQYRYPIAEETLEIPAGKLNPGEDPSVCAQRELREETGYRGDLQFLGRFYTTVGFSDELMYLYKATNLIYDPLEADEDEFVSVEEILWSEAISKAINCEFIDAKTVAGLLVAKGQSL